jgi:CDP-4-dehydro-6-deoxyglucose reductase
MRAQSGSVLGAAREAVEADLRMEQVGRAQRDIAAADQQYPDHARLSLLRGGRAACKTTRLDPLMPHQITIKPSEHSFACPEGDSILAAAMAADLMLPYGCRNGACGTCKGRILEGRVDYGPYQATTLTDDERKSGLALFCCARPQTDLVIEVKEVRRAGDIRIRKLPCRIESIDKAAPDVAIVKIKLPANERLQYLAGQYIDILLKDNRRRSFSIATPPHDDALLELHIRHVPEGFFSGQLFNEFKGREILRFEGPLGAFFLREESDLPIIFVAGGTGFAPIKAVIEHALHHHVDQHRPIVLYWGVRARQDLYLPELPGKWQRDSENFTFIPVLSDPAPGDAWQGRTGLVHQAVLDDFPDLSGYQVYACGGPAMIDVARKTFAEARGLPADAFFADSFTYAPAFEPAR